LLAGDAGINHVQIERGHDLVVQRFVAVNFQCNGRFSLVADDFMR
jgi:hypothetical protein